MTQTFDPDFEQAAYTAFMDGLGAEALASFRQLVAMYRPNMATMQAAAWLTLSPNDKAIFRAVAHRLWREIEAEAVA